MELRCCWTSNVSSLPALVHFDFAMRPGPQGRYQPYSTSDVSSRQYVDSDRESGAACRERWEVLTGSSVECAVPSPPLFSWPRISLAA